MDVTMLAAMLAPLAPGTLSVDGILARAGAVLHPAASFAASAIPLVFHQAFVPARMTLAFLDAGYHIALETAAAIVHTAPLYLHGM